MKNWLLVMRPYLRVAVLGPLVIAAAAAVYSAVEIFCGASDWEGAGAIWLWGAASVWSLFQTDNQMEEIKTVRFRISRLLAWLLLLMAFPARYYGIADIPWFCIALALVCFTGGWRRMFYYILPLFLWLVVVPLQTWFQFLVSYPLRLIGTEMTVVLLQWFGLSVGGSGTVITFGQQQVAITAACSGIEQLEAMMLAGWVIVTLLYRRMSLRWMHFVMILPLILCCNVVRLMVTLFIYHQWGEVAFNERIHTWLGWGMVLLVATVFYQLRFLLLEPSSPEEDKDKEPKS